ncbi:hypothetical protein PR048_018333 [Dryococelus australis]|uniref:Uncharacterized protein n=1 Tax=Dryococelus australis TaxID=614101 RepID=A0ABQ9HBZ0_9NEOP|nr:hypothetical protein PR048_018333 [Dryococelus australis]
MGHIVEVQKYFRNVHQAHGWLLEKVCVMPQMPNETQWNSHPDCVQGNHPCTCPRLSFKCCKDLNMGIFYETVYLEKQLHVVAEALDKL